MPSSIYSLPGRPGPQATTSERIGRWLTAHGAQLGLGALIAFLLAGLAVAVGASRRRLAERGAEELTGIRSQLAQGQRRDALKALDTLIAAQRGNAVSLQATLLKGEILLSDGKHDEAAQAYREALSRTRNPAYRPLVLSALASADIERRQPAQAAEGLETLLRDYPEHFLVPRATMLLGGVRAEQGDWGAARDAFEKIVTLYPRSAWAGEAKARLEEAKRRLPPEPAAPEAKAPN